MSENGTKPRNYLEPYKDEEMVCEALTAYAMNRHMFAKAISQKDYRNREGKLATKEEIEFAMTAAEQADRLAAYAREKADSPILIA